METNPNSIKKFTKFAVFLLSGFCVFFANLNKADAAILSVKPVVGTFIVGSTFDVSIYVNSEDRPINAVELSVSFPPDQLQLVSPNTGKSVIGVWTVQPYVNNQTGRVDYQGGIPGGINVSNGLVTTMTFRVKSVGTAVVKILDNSRVLLNDGRGTNDLNNTNNGVFNLVLPLPEGPVVASDTHPDQSKWYSDANVSLRWAGEDGIEGYSYMLNSEPVDNPDDVVEGSQTNVVYRNQTDGIYYFHIKALRSGGWGGSTHFAVKVDTSPPAQFNVKILPAPRTTRRQPIIEFHTTDNLSGLDHYELKLVPLSQQKIESGQPLFVEATSPYIPQEMQYGDYDVIIRAYDLAGNFEDVSQRISITNSIFAFVQADGLLIRENWMLPWLWFWILALLLIVVLVFISYRVRRWHYRADEIKAAQSLPDHIQEQLNELNEYRQKYGKIAAVILFVICVGFSGLNLTARAQTIEITPPLISSLSSNISNQEIFYAGGKTDAGKTDVILHWQNLQSGETYTATVTSDEKGDWFYRNNAFLPSGKYIVWAQSKIGDQLSAPSPQQNISVVTTGIQFGSSRLSTEAVDFILIILLTLVVLALIVYIAYHARQGRKKHKWLLEEIEAAEESLRRGFAVIKRDLAQELAIIQKAKLRGELSVQAQEKEKQILQDIDEIEARIGKEIWDFEKN